MEWLQSLVSDKQNCYISKGDFDEGAHPTRYVKKIGNFKFGMIHGHDIVPWGDVEALSTVQRQLDCDILISGHTHELAIEQYDGRYLVNPGSTTGAFSGINSAPRPSFLLMNVQD